MGDFFSIIISDVGAANELRTCIERVLLSTSPVTTPFEVSIVTRSSDLEFADIERLHWIRLSPGRSWAEVVNDAVARSAADVLVFIDSDLTPAASWLGEIYATMLERNAGVIGARIIEKEKNTISSAGLVFNQSLKMFYPIYLHFDARFHGVCKTRSFPAVSGSAFAVNRGCFDDVRGFLKGAYEDIDFCLRARIAGYDVALSSGATLYHEGSKSLPRHFTEEDAAKFAAQWELSSAPWNDDSYYFEDGMRVTFDDNGAPRYEQMFTRSYDCVSRAIRMKAAGNIEKAEEYLHEALVLFPGNIEAYEELFFMRYEEGRLDEALQYCEKLLSLNPPHLKAKLLKAKVYLKRGFPALARSLLEETWSTPGIEEDTRMEARELLRKSS